MFRTRRQAAVEIQPDQNGPRNKRNAKAKSKASEEVVVMPLEANEKSDEEPTAGKSLHAKDGRLGFVSSKGFVPATNFILEINSQVYSERYSIKGDTSTEF